jgi:hypothetical protein
MNAGTHRIIGLSGALALLSIGGCGGGEDGPVDARVGADAGRPDASPPLDAFVSDGRVDRPDAGGDAGGDAIDGEVRDGSRSDGSADDGGPHDGALALDAAADGGPLDGGPLDGGPPECIADDGCADNERCDDTGVCVLLEGDLTQRYVIASMDLLEATGTHAQGLDIDEVISDGAGPTCVDLTPDYQSVNDPAELGVDNSFAALLPLASSFLGDACPPERPDGECLDAMIDRDVAAGSMLLVVEVSGIDAWSSDAEVAVTMHRATLAGCDPTAPATCAPMRAGGTIAAGQVYALELIATASSAAIVRGRLVAEIGAIPFPLPFFGVEAWSVRNAELAAGITPTTLSRGSFGGSIAVEEFAVRAEASMPGTGDTARSVLYGISDIAPTAADETRCEDVSLGLVLDAVTAVTP